MKTSLVDSISQNQRHQVNSPHPPKTIDFEQILKDYEPTLTNKKRKV